MPFKWSIRKLGSGCCLYREGACVGDIEAIHAIYEKFGRGGVAPGTGF